MTILEKTMLSLDTVEDVDPYALFERAEAEGWTDGLPMVPPTRAHVDKFIAASGYPGDHVVGQMPPARADATIEKIATNAVLAGCRPEYMPVIIATIEAILDPGEGRAFGGQTTTHPNTLMVIVNGPIVEQLGINGDTGALGPGWRANSTIGRGFRLCVMNIGRSRPGGLDRSTHSSQAKLGVCFAENLTASPWAPLHTDYGYREDESAVLVFQADGPRELNDHTSSDAQHMLTTLCNGIANIAMNPTYLGNHIAICLGPDHAQLLRDEGWTRDEVRRFIYENARVPVGKARLGGLYGMRTWPKWFNGVDDDARIPVTSSADGILIAVVGGAGGHSTFGAMSGYLGQPWHHPIHVPGLILTPREVRRTRE